MPADAWRLRHVNMRILIHIMYALIVIFAVACTDKSAVGDGSQILVRVGNSTLTKNDLVKAVPGGLSKVDSAHYSRAYIRKWIDSHIVSDIASAEIDMDDIDRMVNDYRNRLIALEYKRQMFDAHAANTFSDDTLHNFYVNHNQDFVLERPMLQGVYLKVPEDAPNLAIIRKLYRSDKPQDIDRLEKEVLTSAIHYDYFRDNWIDWEQIELHVPYDFGNDPDEFLKGREHFETVAGGFVYLLDIKDVLPTGAYMPFDNAKHLIIERLTAHARKEYEKNLMSTLYDKSVKEGKIQLFVELEP